MHVECMPNVSSLTSPRGLPVAKSRSGFFHAVVRSAGMAGAPHPIVNGGIPKLEAKVFAHPAVKGQVIPKGLIQPAAGHGERAFFFVRCPRVTLERFQPDPAIDAGRFASGTALCGAAEASLPWLAMSRHHPCRARLRLQAEAVSRAGSMLPDCPLHPCSAGKSSRPRLARPDRKRSSGAWPPPGRTSGFPRNCPSRYRACPWPRSCAPRSPSMCPGRAMRRRPCLAYRCGRE